MQVSGDVTNFSDIEAARSISSVQLSQDELNQ
jgi:hypothetical protein